MCLQNEEEEGKIILNMIRKVNMNRNERNFFKNGEKERERMKWRKELKKKKQNEDWRKKKNVKNRIWKKTVFSHPPTQWQDVTWGHF